MDHRSAFVCGIITATLALPGSYAASVSRAQAQPAPATLSAPRGEVRPWADGVPEAEQAIASELFAAGNHEFTESRFPQAVAKYRAAIAHWDHPAIRFNLAVSLIDLDQLLEARDQLERSVAYGVGPLGADLYNRALTYRKLLDARLARVKISCREPRAQITLDGNLLFTGPGTAEPFLLPGAHQIVATKAGFQTASRTVVLAPGQRTTEDIAPTLADRAPPLAGPHWRYWRHLGIAGVAVVGVGAMSYASARSEIAAYDDGVHVRCSQGCTGAALERVADLQARKATAEREQAIAVTAFAVGGAAIATGLIGMLVDQAPASAAPRRARPGVSTAGRGTVITLSWGF